MRYTCPDGKVYEVGDNNDGCASLAGYGGKVTTACKPGGIAPESAGMMVRCAGANQYRKTPNVGSWGGSCTCPDGKVSPFAPNKLADKLTFTPPVVE